MYNIEEVYDWYRMYSNNSEHLLTIDILNEVLKHARDKRDSLSAQGINEYYLEVYLPDITKQKLDNWIFEENADST